jgi:thiol-disulfide isomerase/thioredoxin
VSWKNSLAAVIADTTIKKTVSDSDINNEPCNVVTLSIFKKVLAYLGGIYEVTDTINFTFKLTVSQKTKWPVLTIVSNNANKHKAVIYYTGIEPEPKVPDDKYFYYSSYTGTKIYTNQATNRLLQVGTKAPEFTVASLINNQAVSLSNGKGKITIVEFFIRNCGPYIAAIPELNKLHEQYSSKLEILAVNPTDKLPAIQLFKNQYQPLYKIGINGEAVAKQYGVQGFPATFIVNKEGLIIYSGEGFDIKKIEAVLKKEFL